MTSICSTYWQVILAQGLVVGIGNGLLFVPSIAVLPTYFVKWRALATGIAITGGNIGESHLTIVQGSVLTVRKGGIIYPIVFQRLKYLGFRWATRIIAFIMLTTLTVPLFAMKMRMKPSVARRLFDTSALTETPFTVFAIASFFGSTGLYIPYFYVESYARELGIVQQADLVFYLVAFLNAGSVVGRLVSLQH